MDDVRSMLHDKFVDRRHTSAVIKRLSHAFDKCIGYPGLGVP